MKITVTHTTGGTEHLELILETNLNIDQISFDKGIPKDVFSIKDLLIMAYNAGKDGETLEVEEIKVKMEPDEYVECKISS